ncbi:MAG: ABC transporter ATP-binding protein [Oscillospiraceae bacterium]
MDNNNFLTINDLTVHYVLKKETVCAVNNLSLTMRKGETLGLVGETGAGKTTIAKTIMGILPHPPAKVLSGEVILDGKDILKQTEPELCEMRGKAMSMIFQDPMTALNPVMSVGNQIAEVIELHEHCSKVEARERAEKMLETVGIPAERYVEYPHQFSGGMKQRVVIAIALACSPELLIADEPTTALDVTIQAQMLDLMRDLHEQRGTSTIMITHDLGVVGEMCDDVAVIYAGEIVEYGSLEDIFDRMAHPYTVGLFGAVPSLEGEEERLSPVEGLPPDPSNLPTGCKFHPRCKFATEQCSKEAPPYKEIAPGHFCRCFKEGTVNG